MTPVPIQAYPCVLRWKWPCVKVGAKGPEYIATIKHLSETDIFLFWIKTLKLNCVFEILCPTTTFQRTRGATRNALSPPPGAAHEKCLSEKTNKKRVNLGNWLGFSAFSCCFLTPPAVSSAQPPPSPQMRGSWDPAGRCAERAPSHLESNNYGGTLQAASQQSLLRNAVNRRWI